jgi:CxxC motif-containing protein
VREVLSNMKRKTSKGRTTPSSNTLPIAKHFPMHCMSFFEMYSISCIIKVGYIENGDLFF